MVARDSAIIGAAFMPDYASVVEYSSEPPNGIKARKRMIMTQSIRNDNWV